MKFEGGPKDSVKKCFWFGDAAVSFAASEYRSAKAYVFGCLQRFHCAPTVIQKNHHFGLEGFYGTNFNFILY